MRKVWTLCVAALLTSGCKSGEEPVRGANQGLPSSATYSPAPEKPRLVDTPPLDLRRDPLLVLERYGKDDTEEPERDLSQELQTAVGVPTDCVRDFEASRPTTIRINVSGIVRPTGMVIQPTAYGSGLSNVARECIEQRVGNVVLKALDATVSETVSTVIEIEYEPPVVVEAVPGVPQPVLRDVRAPLPKRPTIPLGQGKAISGWPTKEWISGGFDGGIPIESPTSKKITGPKPRAIDGYEVDENAQSWSDR